MERGMAPYERTLISTWYSYERMRAAHPAELAPASVFFTHDPRGAMDRRNSFRVKAALVYWAITGHHVDDHMLRANHLLLALATACHSAIPQQNDAGNAGTKTEEISKEKKVEEAGGGGGLTKTEEISKEKKIEESGADGGSTKTEEISKEKKVEEAGGSGGTMKTEEIRKEKKVEEAGGNGATKTKEISKEKKVKKAGGEPGNGSPKASTEPQKAEEKAEVIDEAWDARRKQMVDGIFLVVGFLPKLKHAMDKSADRDGVDNIFKSQHMHDIVTDVIKLENQLPLWVLLHVADIIEAVVNATLASDEFRDIKDSVTGGAKYKLSFTRDTFDDVVRDFCWYYSPFFTKKAAAAPPKNNPFKGVATDAKMAERTLLDCLHQSVAPAPTRGALAAGGPSRMPSAKELRRSGIRVLATETGRAEIEFKEQWATLRLPALAYNFKLATVARNLLAREYEQEQLSKPVTRFFQMMNEVVEDLVDVRILNRVGVVRCGPWHSAAEDVLALIKNIDGHATFPSVYMPMDREIHMVRQHYDKRMNNFFVRNRPGVLWASSVAALSMVVVLAARKKRG